MPKQPNRVNVVVTPEQHALLLEFAKLDPSTRSASAFLRGMLDRVTPLLRELVPVMRLAAEEKDQARQKVRGALEALTAEIEQLDLLGAADAPSAPSVSEGARSAKRRRA